MSLGPAGGVRDALDHDFEQLSPKGTDSDRDQPFSFMASGIQPSVGSGRLLTSGRLAFPRTTSVSSGGSSDTQATHLTDHSPDASVSGSPPSSPKEPGKKRKPPRYCPQSPNATMEPRQDAPPDGTAPDGLLSPTLPDIVSPPARCPSPSNKFRNHHQFPARHPNASSSADLLSSSCKRAPASPSLRRKSNAPYRLQVGLERKYVTLVVMNISGMNKLASGVQWSSSASVLDDLSASVVPLVQKHKGVVVSFAGGRLVAGWNTVIPSVNHAVHACTCALALAKTVDALSQQWCQKGLPELRGRFAVASAIMAVGNVGSPENGMSFCVLSGWYNVLHALEQLNNVLGTTVLMTPKTRQEVELQFTHRQVDVLQLSGVPSMTIGDAERLQRLSVYEVMARNEPEEGLDMEWMYQMTTIAEDTAAYNKAFAHYIKGNFKKALGLWDSVLTTHPTDSTVIMFRRTTAAMLASPTDAERWPKPYRRVLRLNWQSFLQDDDGSEPIASSAAGRSKTVSTRKHATRSMSSGRRTPATSSQTKTTSSTPKTKSNRNTIAFRKNGPKQRDAPMPDKQPSSETVASDSATHGAAGRS